MRHIHLEFPRLAHGERRHFAPLAPPDLGHKPAIPEAVQAAILATLAVVGAVSIVLLSLV